MLASFEQLRLGFFAADRRFQYGCAGLFFATLVAGLVGLHLVNLMDVDEPRFVAASRTMARGGDLFVPMFNGYERFDKPILIYWLQALSFVTFGEGELAARLPSVASIAACAPLTAAIGRRLGLSPVYALAAGLALAACLQVQIAARAATAEALLLLCVTAAAYLQVRIFVGTATSTTRLLLWATIGAAFLTKGPPAIVAPAALAIGMWRAGYRVNWARFRIGCLFALTLVLAWAVPALMRSEGRFWDKGMMHHVVERTLTPFEGHGGYAPWWYLFYFGTVPISFLPFSPFLLKLWRRGRQADRDPVPSPSLPVAKPTALLWWWFAGTFAVFTLATSKLPHYLLPAFPALALLAAFAIQQARAHGERANDRLVAGLLVVVGLILLGAPSGIHLTVGQTISPQAVLCGAIFAIGLWTAASYSARGDHLRSMILASLVMLVSMGLTTGSAAWNFSTSTVTASVQRARPPELLTQSGKQLYTFRLNLPSLTYYLDRQVNSVHDPVAALNLILSPGHVVLTEQSQLPGLQAAVDAWFEHELGVAATAPVPVSTAELESRRKRIRTSLASPVRRLAGYMPSKGRRAKLVVLDAKPDS